MPKSQETKSSSESDSDSSAGEMEFSDTEVTWEVAKKFKLRFGIYKGKRLGVMIRNKKRRSILRHYLKWEDLQSEARISIDAALEHYESLKQ